MAYISHSRDTRDENSTHVCIGSVRWWTSFCSHGDTYPALCNILHCIVYLCSCSSTLHLAEKPWLNGATPVPDVKLLPSCKTITCFRQWWYNKTPQCSRRRPSSDKSVAASVHTASVHTRCLSEQTSRSIRKEQ